MESVGDGEQRDEAPPKARENRPQWLREGGAVLCSFIDWFLLLLVARCLLACLVSLSYLVSRISCVRELHFFIISLV